MNTKIALYVSCAAVGLSLCALAVSILAALAGWKFAPVPAHMLQAASLIWPIALYAAAVYRRHHARQSEK